MCVGRPDLVLCCVIAASLFISKDMSCTYQVRPWNYLGQSTMTDWMAGWMIEPQRLRVLRSIYIYDIL